MSSPVLLRQVFEVTDVNPTGAHYRNVPRLLCRRVADAATDKKKKSNKDNSSSSKNDQKRQDKERQAELLIDVHRELKVKAGDRLEAVLLASGLPPVRSNQVLRQHLVADSKSDSDDDQDMEADESHELKEEDEVNIDIYADDFDYVQPEGRIFKVLPASDDETATVWISFHGLLTVVQEPVLCASLQQRPLVEGSAVSWLLNHTPRTAQSSL